MNDCAVPPVVQTPRCPLPQGAPAQRNDDTATLAAGMLNRALAMSRMMALRCKREYHTALRLHSPPLAAAALEHANEAGGHADKIRERIRELGGEPDQPAAISLPAQQTELEAPNPLAAVIADDLSSARATVAGYREIAASLVPVDPSTSHLLEEIIEGESERADDLAELLAATSGRPGR